MDDAAKLVPAPVRAGVTTTKEERNWPMNCWWVVAQASEVSSAPVSRWILEMPLVLYRKADGDLVALHDRCPHRWAPLSMGWVEGDNVVCSYHGMQFSPAGKCVRFPTLALGKEPNVRIRSFPVAERYNFIWIWTGEAEMADAALIPDHLAYLSDPDLHVVWGYKAVEANYMQIKENVCDLSHFAFLHKDTAGVVGWERLPSVKVDGERVTFSLEFEETPLPPTYAIPLGVPIGTPANRNDHTVHLSPAVVHSWSDIENPIESSEDRDILKHYVVHLTTPVSTTKSHYFWAFARDFGGPFDIEQTRAAANPVFSEDVRVVEATQAMVRRTLDQDDAIEISIMSDRASIETRRSVARVVRAEREAERAGLAGE